MIRSSPEALRKALRLIVITDARMAAPRTVESIVAEALTAGAPAIQLRDKEGSVRQILPLAHRLRELTRRANALFFVNDRADLALAVAADGVHLGPDDIPPERLRPAVPEGFLIGYSADDPDVARAAVADGAADYIGCGTVWATGSKTDAGEAIGPEGVARVVDAVDAPVVAIGGITVERAAAVLSGSGAAGLAVVGAVMAAEDPGAAVRDLLAAF